MAYPHVAARIFNTPLLLAPDKAEVIVAALSSRFLGQGSTDVAAASSGPDRRECDFTVTDTGIATIPISGTLVRRHDWVSAASGLTSYEHIRAAVEDAVTDPRVQALLLDIDSPGGEVAGLFDLVDFLSEARQIKPVWAVANDQAYSAAYGIASACERIYTTRSGGVGSVGVIAVHLDSSGADRAQGLAYTVFRAGRYKAEHNSYEPLTDHARQTMQDELDRLYALFAGQVARNRGLTLDQVARQEAQVYRGPAGVEQHLADAVGTLEQARADLEGQLQQPQRPKWPGMVTAATAAHSPQEDDMPTTTPHPIPAAASADDAPPVANVAAAVSPDPPALDEAQVRAEAVAADRAYQKEVRELCHLAGRVELADAFIERQLACEHVRAALLEQQAAEDEALQVTATTVRQGDAEPAPSLDLAAITERHNEYYHAALARADRR
jgi:signal peptide peptidase SppA